VKFAKYALIILVVLLLGAQAIRPERTNPPSSNPFPIGDPEVETILKRSCFDCHSNETRWPWYSSVAPMSWQIADHVEDGRGHMNFSDWNAEKAAKRLDEICEEIREGKMPLKGYELLHSEAKLSAADKDTLCTWAGARLAALGKPPESAGEEATHEEEH
jgi:hypothetical protein